MKTLKILKTISAYLLVLGSSVAARAQGTVQFNNGFTFLTATDQSRLVYLGIMAAGKELVGT